MIIKNRIKIKKKWAYAYFLILIVPVVISSILLFVIESNTENEINQMNVALLTPLKQELERELENTKSIYTEMNIMLEVSGILDDSVDGKSKYKQFERFCNQTKSVIATQPIVKNVCFFFRDYNIAISAANGISDMETIHRVIFGNYEDYKPENILPTKRSGDFKFVKINSNDIKKDTMIFTGNLPIGSSITNPSATLVAILDENFLIERIESIREIDGREIYITDSEDNILFSNAVQHDIDLSKLTEPNKLYFQGGKTCSYIPLEGVKWKCVLVTPGHMYSGRIALMRMLIFINIIMSLLFGGFCAVWALRRNYSPIQRILNQIRINSSEQQSEDMDEFDFMTHFIEDLIHRQRKDSASLEKQSEILIPAFFARLISAKNRSSTKELAEAFSLSFPYDKFVVVILDLVGAGELFPDHRFKDETQRTETANLILTNIMTEKLSIYHTPYIFEYEGAHIVIVCVDDKRENPIEDIRTEVEEGVLAMQNYFSISANIACSALHSEIAECYKEAYETFEYMRLLQENGFVCYDEIEGRSVDENDNYYFSLEQEIQLANCIKAGNIEDAQGKLDEIFSKNLVDDRSNVKAIRNLMIDISYTILKIGTHSGERIKLDDILTNTNNLSEMKDSIRRAVDMMCEKFKEDVTRSENIVAQVIAFTDKHYCDINLSLQMIGSTLHLTPYYISKIFKKEKGYSLLEYIRKLRVEKAKQLMCEHPEYKLENIAESVGMADARMLARAFKLECGILPSEYQNLQKKDEP